jgi:hypothetical protein
MAHGPCKAIWANLDSTKVARAKNVHFLFFGLSRTNCNLQNELKKTQNERKFPQTATNSKKKLRLVILGLPIFHVHCKLMEFGSLGHRTWHLSSSSLAMHKNQKLEHF